MIGHEARPLLCSFSCIWRAHVFHPLGVQCRAKKNESVCVEEKSGHGGGESVIK